MPAAIDVGEDKPEVRAAGLNLDGKLSLSLDEGPPPIPPLTPEAEAERLPKLTDGTGTVRSRSNWPLGAPNAGAACSAPPPPPPKR
mmetsp:Transcript_73942/g.186350  ORF Transcript_73942/g.186350 Transcript_73942/m.186350 type:complete len:86 (-) Transcript_73942:2316-2573(-)